MSFASLNYQISTNARLVLGTKTVPELQKLYTIREWTSEMTDIFGADAKNHMHMVRTAIFEVLMAKQNAPEIRTGNVLTDAWIGKAEVIIEEDDLGCRELVVVTDGTQVRTGKGPLMEVQPVAPINKYLLVIMSTFMKETVTDGITSAVTESLAKKYSGINLSHITAYAGILETQRGKIYPQKENLCGIPFQKKLNVILEKMGTKESQDLSTHYVVNVLGEADPHKNDLTRAVPLKKAEKPEYIHQMFATDKERKEGKAVLIQRSGVPVQIKATKTVKMAKTSHALLPEVDWIQMMTTAMGGNSVKAITAGSGICPGITEQEASTVRFISVGLWLLSKGKKLVVSAPVNMLVFFAMSAASYLKEESKGKAFDDVIRLDTTGLKSAVRASLMDHYQSIGAQRKGWHYFSWNPKSFSAQATMDKTLEMHRKFYSGLEEYKEYTVYKEVLEPNDNLHYYIDGYPDTLTFWETTTAQLEAMELRHGKYHSSPLVEIKAGALFSTARSMNAKRLTHVFCPTNTRSYRILVVKGQIKMTVTITADGEEFFTTQAHVIDEADFAGEAESEDESQEPVEDEKVDDPPEAEEKLQKGKKTPAEVPKNAGAKKQKVSPKTKPKKEEPPEEDTDASEEEDIPDDGDMGM
jgi:hypothetical protein